MSTMAKGTEWEAITPMSACPHTKDNYRVRVKVILVDSSVFYEEVTLDQNVFNRRPVCWALTDAGLRGEGALAIREVLSQIVPKPNKKLRCSRTPPGMRQTVTCHVSRSVTMSRSPRTVLSVSPGVESSEIRNA